MGGRARCALVVAAVVAAGGVGGCSSNCGGSLSDIGQGCPATFDGDLGGLPCSSPFLVWETLQCGPLTTLTAEGGSVGKTCVYDAATHALVGARNFSDMAIFCGGQSHEQKAGQQVDVMMCPTTPVTRRCSSPDAGAD
jgi:hypothetical protein